MKIGNLKKGKMMVSIFIYIYTIHFAYLEIYTKFEKKTLAPIGAEISVTQVFIGEKEKKWTDKHYVAVFILHNITHHYQVSYQISES